MKKSTIIVFLVFLVNLSFAQNLKRAEKQQIRNTLDQILKDDQGLRRQISVLSEKYGPNSKQLDSMWIQIAYQDSINLTKVEHLIAKYGWLGSSLVGASGATTLFLVIQHSDLDVQIKYLPMLRAAVKKGEADPSNLAMLEDRVAMRQAKPQIYGSQIRKDMETGMYYVYHLIETEKVDERRAAVGLGKLSEYVSNWGIVWDVENHKRNIEKHKLK
jgi:hypothetical protein